ncbi:hypothetical protein KVR01_013749 [Diaporthe batatas]|uniref:uncharacterized protein n=1 Tax=Diaporthe batatas TaxID=748121 RepID=UPI001D058386|nr:uncharacterized protein KVR01_013749 [Diaporthe batatas]KAG8156408.1 hypothetical protein KVR01_013749 [Diaporthe batatas]
MDRLRDLATRTRRADYHFRIPKSLSTTSLMAHKSADLLEGSTDGDARSALSSASSSFRPQPLLPDDLGAAMSPYYPVPASSPAQPPPPSGAKPTTVQPRAQEAASSAAKNKTAAVNMGKKQPRMNANRGGEACLNDDDPFFTGHKADQQLFGQVLTTIAQDDVIENSGRELFKRVNECARDYMEAKQVVEQREHEIAAISTKIEAMQATMDKASKHLHKAQAIAAEAIDSSVAEQFRIKELENLTNILIGMTNAIARGNCHNWPRDKVNKHLEELQSVFYKNKHYCQSLMVGSGIAYVAKHFVFHADYDDAFEPMLFHLANQTDYKGFVRRSREEDHDVAKQYQVVYTARPGCNTKTSTAASAAPPGREGPTDKIKDCRVDGGAPEQAPDDAARVAQAGSYNLKQTASQTSVTLPPRSSSLPSSARKLTGKASHQAHHGQRTDAPGDAVFSGPHRNTAHIHKHFELTPDADMNKMADKIRAHLESQPGLTSDNLMKAAVMESIAGLEAVFQGGTAATPPKVRKDAASVLEDIERLNKDFVMSEQVTRKLSAAADKLGFRSVQTHDLPGGRIQIDVTTAGCFEGCGHKPANSNGQASSTTSGNIPGQDMAASRGDSDQLWKDHYVPSITPGKL